MVYVSYGKHHKMYWNTIREMLYGLGFMLKPKAKRRAFRDEATFVFFLAEHMA